MFYYKFPSILYKTNLFNPNHFAVSNISPSLGEYLINSIFALLIVSTAFYQLKNLNFERLNLKIISVIVILISFLSLYIFSNAILQIYSGSQYLLDLKLNASAIGSEFKIASLAVFIIQSLIYLIIQYYCFRNIKLHNWGKKEFIFGVLILIIICLISAYFQLISIFLLLSHLLYLAIIIFFNLKISLNKYHYKATIFIVISAIFCSFVGTYTHYTQELISDFTKKQQFAKTKLDENDPMGEFLIEIANESIKNSLPIKSLLTQPSINFDLVDTEIKKHLKNWFDKYHIDVYYYGKSGENLKNVNTKLLEKEWGFYVENGNKTLIENLYLIASGQLDKTKKYVYRTKIDLKNNEKIEIIIVFNSFADRSGVSNGNQVIAKSEIDYEYKIFQKNALETKLNQAYSTPDAFEKKLLNDKNIFDKVLIINNIAYSALRINNGKTILVFSEVSPKSDIFRTFSFLFIIQILTFITGLIIISYFFGENNFNESYATRIQIYFGLAFLIPLFITLVVVFNLISKSHFKSENIKYEKIAFDINKQISAASELYGINKGNKYIWHDLLHKIANDFDVNINLYSAKGQFISKVDFLENKIEKDENEVLAKQIFQQKSSGSLNIKSQTKQNLYLLYQPIYSKNGNAIAFFSLPFYPTNSFENNETNELFGSILGTFAVIFLLFLIISVLISNRLIQPLSLITNYLQNTDLKNRNQPIEIKSKDEIGLLVDGYNNMLAKIEEGKKEISANEKQTAWLDIAKQVAHEIKNPLTPMKLNLQHLENIFSKEKDIDKGKVLVKISSLLHNIENISDIVDSFMAFAKMPLPKNVKLDLLKPIKIAFELYSNIEGIHLQIDSKIKKAYIFGDEKVLSQIVNNLIINAMQSIPTDKVLQIIIELTKIDSNYLIKISDNGTGISDELSKKIFLPNFSTKMDGLGVGLSLAKWGIENMNGEIWFESKVGEGSTFFIEMPVFKD
jgi:two-component system, NtrC family, nitrogen regulation sensor histidine kinase NtrY